MTQQTKSARRAAGAPINERGLLTRQMAADYLSISVASFKRLEACHEIKGIPILSGAEKRYRLRDLDALIDEWESGDTPRQRAMASA